MPTPSVLKPVFSGLPLSGADLNSNWATLEQSFLDIGPYVVSGLVPAAGTGLSVNVTGGTAVLGVHQAFAGFVIGSLAANQVNDLYLLETGQGTAAVHPSSQPANSVLLGTATTGAGSVTSVNTGRTSGRQQFLQPQNLVPGGPSAGAASAGHPASVNLASWAAAAAEGVAVYGALPAGAGGAFGTIVAPPLAAAFSTLNVTTATLTNSTTGLWLNAPNIATIHAQCWVKALAAGAYTWIVKLESLLFQPGDCSAGILLRDSAGGKIITFGNWNVNSLGYYLQVAQWTDANTRSGNAQAYIMDNAGFPWLKITDDGTTNRTYSVSRDGVNWLDVLTEARTTWLLVAPNQVGIFAVADAAPAALAVYSWSGV